MKKLAIAAAVALSVFNFSETEAAEFDVDNAEIVELSHWTKFRDHVTGRRQREKERERYERYERERWEREQRERERWEREHRRHRHPPGHYPPPPPPPHHR